MARKRMNPYKVLKMKEDIIHMMSRDVPRYTILDTLRHHGYDITKNNLDSHITKIHAHKHKTIEEIQNGTT